MSITEVTSNYRAEKIPDIIKDYRQIRTAFGLRPEEDDTPWWSGDIVQEAKAKDYLCARALTSMAVLNGSTNVSEFVSAWKQIKSGLKNKTLDGYDPKIAQHPFSFFRGTILHEYLNPNSEKCINRKIAKKVVLWDVSLRETKFGDWILDKLGVKEVDEVSTNIESLLHTKDFPYYVQAKVYKSKNLFGDLTARALSRTSLIGTGALGCLGAIHTAYKVKQGGDIIEESAKTALQIGTTLVGMGYLGAIGYKHLGTLGSLIGIGAGTALGNYAPKLFAFSKKSSETV